MNKKKEIDQKIIEAALNEFLSKGFEASSMEQIAKKAETSKRTLYKYYPSKDILLDQIMSDLLLESKQKLQIKYNSNKSIKEQLSNLIDSKVNLLTSESYLNIAKLVLVELMKSKELNQDQLDEFYQSELMFIQWVNAAKKDGKITTTLSSELIANQFHSILKGQIFYPVIFGLTKLTPNAISQAKESSLSFFLTSFCK
jgi:TetR/AcrR family transcriptional regulator of autoinduction and epiphytic fitness